MKIHLIGQKETKRYDYFFKACSEMGAKLEFWDINSSLVPFMEAFSVRDCIKIDPPKYESSDLRKLNELVSGYKSQLDELEAIDGAKFINTPSAIWKTLDKKCCKKILQENGICTTPMLDADFASLDELKVYMMENKIYSVFIKPRFGSGAAGVIAYRLHPGTGEELIQTCIRQVGDSYQNTKKIQKTKDKNIIKTLIDFMISQDAIVEKWIPKPKIGDSVYDLRVVFQFGKIDYILARESAGSAITNLHLNNQALDLSELDLTQQVISDIYELSQRAVSYIDGLQSAGIDILLNGKTKKPMIIEINAQGDLLYKDIFKENMIYKNQVKKIMDKG